MTILLQHNLTQKQPILADEIESRRATIKKSWGDAEKRRRAQLASIRTEALLISLTQDSCVAQSA